VAEPVRVDRQPPRVAQDELAAGGWEPAQMVGKRVDHEGGERDGAVAARGLGRRENRGRHKPGEELAVDA